jgi:5-bromo-4-chloroindolyl phosphate hydrolysis protein
MSNAKRYNPSIIKFKRPRGWLFYVFLIPLFFSVIFALFGFNIKALMLNAIAFIMMYSTLHIAKKGFIQESEYNEAKLTKAPQKQYKLIAAIMLGVSVFYSSFIAGNNTLFTSLFLTTVSIVGFVLYYGLDPKKDKLKNFGDISSELVLNMLNETEDKIENIKKEATKIDDTLLKSKVDIAIQRSNRILEALIDDPKDIRVARKFLVVYLDGISDVVSSYNAVEEDHISHETRAKLLELMDDVEVRLEKELTRLKANNLFDLDVNIDTLKEQIKN